MFQRHIVLNQVLVPRVLAFYLDVTHQKVVCFPHNVAPKIIEHSNALFYIITGRQIKKINKIIINNVK